MLPRLLVVTDVPVTDTVAGSLQLFRLLGGYPVDRLCICEGTLGLGHPIARRLRDVRHVSFDSGSPRWRRSRLVRLQAVWLTLTLPRGATRIAQAIQEFTPDAVLAVAQEFSCFAAWAFAHHRGIPLHLIIHDDWLAFSRLPAWFVPYARRRFGQLYSEAAERWCISAAMEEYYRRLWGMAGEVLLPIHGGQIEAERTVRVPTATMTVAYAGSVPTGGRAKLLLEFAESISAGGHRLALMVPGGAQAVFLMAEKVRCQLRPNNMDDLGAMPPAQITRELARRADALLVAETFDPVHHDSVAYNFPCKLADYTAAGLPIIVWAPPYSSAARWARENTDAATLIDNDDPAVARGAIDRLAGDPALRVRMAEAAARASRQQFDLGRARERLYGAIAASYDAHRS